MGNSIYSAQYITLKTGIENMLHVAPSAEVTVVKATTSAGKSSYYRSPSFPSEEIYLLKDGIHFYTQHFQPELFGIVANMLLHCVMLSR